MKCGIEQFIKKHDQCAEQGKFNKAWIELPSIPIKTKIIGEMRVYLNNLSKGFKHIVVCIV